MRLHPLVLSFSISLFVEDLVSSSEDEERLMVDVFRGYNSLIPPIRNLSDMPLIVRVAMQLFLLIDVAEKDQVMHTNVWLTLKWHDFQMRWNPVNYGEIKEMRISPDKVWLPDIVLFNNADGNYEVSFMCNVVINYHGDMLWVPPAIYKSSCIIDVEFFPFDEQVCTLVFGSWTYNENEIKLEFEQAELADLSEYEPSSIWDVIDAPAQLVNRRSRIEFQVRIRRKTLFYTIILIIPTLIMGTLNMAVFFLPTDSGEKMTLTISVMLSIVVFLLLVSKILPPTSSTIPLMAKYLLLTFVLNVITILITIVIINVYFRSPTTHRMPEWVRMVFLEWMPFLMCMQRPKSASRKLMSRKKRAVAVAQLPGVGKFTLNRATHHPLCPSADDRTASVKVLNSANDIPQDPDTAMFYPLSPDALRAIDAIEYITDHIVQEKEYKMHCDDWRFVAMIIDRLLLYIFFGITAGGTCGILFSAPYVFEGVNQREVLDKLINLYKTGGIRD
ncbi:Cation transporter family protein [Teladorsagia circumcincta]|uniref:Cation transporter family protein n=1 Tax=Teladorsagia circumcincta TaxID=45464 RepID=A0A2G9T370_TELCI|nr:Cation transporter family protein [Teladorsagia circumcincta]